MNLLHKAKEVVKRVLKGSLHSVRLAPGIAGNFFGTQDGSYSVAWGGQCTFKPKGQAKLAINSKAG
jgi:hypothetical protein